MTNFRKKQSALPNANAAAAQSSLAHQPNNILKGFDATKIDKIDPAIIEALIAINDLASLGAQQKVAYIKMLCESLGLNPLSRPLQLVEFTDPSNTSQKRLTVYATKDCAEQLRKLHGVSIDKLTREVDTVLNICIYTAIASDKYGRTDVSTGAVALETAGKAAYVYNGQQIPAVEAKPLSATAKANAIMKAETKAKRRVTLSICGLGFLDETQLEDLQDAKIVEVEIIDNPATANKAAEDEKAAKMEELFADAKKDAEAVKIVEDLEKIHDKYKDLFENDKDPNYLMFRRILLNRSSEIKREETKAQVDAAATAEPQKIGGLL